MSKYIFLYIYYFLNKLFFFFIKIKNSFLIFFIIKNKKLKNKYIFPMEFSSAIGPLFSSTKFTLNFIKEKKIPFKKVVFFYSKGMSNNILIKLLKRKFKLYQSEKFYKIFFLSYNFFSCKVFKFHVPNGHTSKKNYKINLKFNSIDNKKISIILKKLKIENKKIILINNRESFFYRNDDFNSYRNSRFDDLIKTINYLKKKNYEIIRVGDYDNAKVKNIVKIKHIMNLEPSYKKIFDIYAQMNCYFSIVPSSGLAYLPYFFNKPTLCHNYIPYGESPSVDNGIIIPKIIKHKKSKKILTIKEILNIKSFLFNKPHYHNFHLPIISRVSMDKFQSSYLYEKKGVFIQDNTDTEILEGTKELIKFILFNKKIPKHELVLIKKFKSLFPVDHPLYKTKALISPYWIKKYYKYLI